MPYGEYREGYQRVISGYGSRKTKYGTKREPIYAYIPIQQQQQQQAAPAPAPAPAAPAPLMPQISEASKQYRAETQALSDKIAKQQADFNASQEAAAQAGAIAAANQSRSGQTANFQIQPASSTPKTGGTQPFKRRRDQFKISKPNYSGLSISKSEMVNV
jgi:hypothetical protein